MANVGGKRRAGERVSFKDQSVQEFVPSAAWTEDSLTHYLLVDLPDFRKEEVKLHVDKSGEITVSGERLVNNDKYLHFKKSFKAPENADIGKISGKFEGDMLYVFVPKQAQVEKKEYPKNEIEEKDGVVAKDKVQEKEKMSRNDQDQDQEQKEKKEESKKGHSCVDGFKRENIEKWEGENSMLEKAIFMVRKNRDILLTAALAFSLGVLVSRKFEFAARL